MEKAVAQAHLMASNPAEGAALPRMEDRTRRILAKAEVERFLQTVRADPPHPTGRYSPRGPDGRQCALNVYGHTPEECEEKLKVLIVTMKAEIQAERRQLREAEIQP